jgi:hypothetical protein
MNGQHDKKDFQYHSITRKHKKVLLNITDSNNDDVDCDVVTPDGRAPFSRGYYRERDKIYVDNLRIAPLEKSDFLYDARVGRGKPQSQRCRYCHQLIAVGEPFLIHSHFCRGDGSR